MTIYSLYLISKSGSLLYQRDFKSINSPITPQNSNDYLIIASNLHGIHAIAAKLTPSVLKPDNNINTNTNNNSSNLVNSNNGNTIIKNVTSNTMVVNSDIDNNIVNNNTNNNSSNKKINTNSNKTGLRFVSTEKFNMFIHQTVSGLKIILFTSKDTFEYQISEFQNTIYKIYSDYVLKNPFYNLDMPIRIKLFDDKINSATINYNIK
jgi:hypothetical protein